MSKLLKVMGFMLAFVVLAISICAAAPKKDNKFTIYEFIPYKDYVSTNSQTPNLPLSQYLQTLDIHPIDVIYLDRFMTNGQPDDDKIQAIAQGAIDTPSIPVSFDTEFGDRFQPATVIPGVTEILDVYHRYNKVTPVGVYATAPQNTYGWSPRIAYFDKLNLEYQPIAQKVDFLSPVLYNDEGDDTATWKLAAAYNIAAAKKYDTGKPIIPYISPVIRLPGRGVDNINRHGPIQMLTEDEMRARLQTLYDLGADGCIVWSSSGDRTADGKMPVFDRSTGWGKALADFAAAHE